MRLVKRIAIGCLSVTALVCLPLTMLAQDDAQKAELQQKLKDQFTLTKVTADNSDIVTPGSILTLQMDGLQMCSIDANLSMPNTLKNGKITTTMGDRIMWNMLAPKAGVNAQSIPMRKFVAGEKFFVKRYQVDKDGVGFEFYSDPYNNLRYWGQIKIPLPKGHFPPVEDAMKMITQVFTVDSAQSASQPTPQSAPPAPAPAPEPQPVAMAPIAPPPPPVDALPVPPKTIALGQTKDQVAAIMGQPTKVADLGPKEIDYYPDMKVIFVKGKVTDIQ